MKRLFLPAMISSVVLFSACNNESSTTTETTTTDTMNATSTTTSDMATAGSNVMKKTGLVLTSAKEVPANTSTASGTADVSYNKDNQMLTYTVSWTALTGPPSMAHIHGTAAKGVNAGVKEDLSKLLSKSVAGSFTDSVKVDGSKIKEDSLLAGFYYFNIHTAAHPGGEIRAQIEF